MQDRKKTWDPGNSVLKIPATWDSKNSKKDGLEKYREALADMGLSTFQHENRPAEEVRSELYKSLPSSGMLPGKMLLLLINCVLRRNFI